MTDQTTIRVSADTKDLIKKCERLFLRRAMAVTGLPATFMPRTTADAVVAEGLKLLKAQLEAETDALNHQNAEFEAEDLAKGGDDE